MRRLRSDQGATFVAAKHELKIAVAELHNERIRSELLQENCDWITFIVNVPSSSYRSGLLEASCLFFFKVMACNWMTSQLRPSCVR